MKMQNNAEYKELLFLNQRLLIHIEMVNSVKDNVKALKCCEKLIKIERSALKKSKTPVSYEELNAVLWRYADFADIVKRLRKTNNAGVYGKAVSDLDGLIKKTADEIADLQENLAGQSADEAENTQTFVGAQELASQLAAAAKNVAEKVADGAKKVGDAVGDGAEKLKKILAGDENCE